MWPFRINSFLPGIVMISAKNVITVGSLIKKDLKDAYFLPQQPSSYSKGYRFQNDKKYRVYDSPPPSLIFNQLLFPWRNLPAAGDEIPVIMDNKPPLCLQEHWKKWLPAFSQATVKSVDEALLDEVPFLTYTAQQSIPEQKHSIHPDIMYKLPLKSSIPEIGVPVPRHMDENSISYPCAIKIDMGWTGRGSRCVKSATELSDALWYIRDACGWKGGIVLQEFLSGVNEVPGFQFHVDRSGEIFWIGTSEGKFDVFEWVSSTVDWNKQEEYRNSVYEDLTVPIANYLQKSGYFDVVTSEVLFTDNGKYLVDLNPRISADTTHMLLARYMALEVGLKYSEMFPGRTHNVTGEKLVEKANNLNKNNVGKIVILSVADAVNIGCHFDASVFGQTPEEVQALFKSLHAGLFDF